MNIPAELRRAALFFVNAVSGSLHRMIGCGTGRRCSRQVLMPCHCAVEWRHCQYCPVTPFIVGLLHNDSNRTRGRTPRPIATFLIVALNNNDRLSVVTVHYEVYLYGPSLT